MIVSANLICVLKPARHFASDGSVPRADFSSDHCRSWLVHSVFQAAYYCDDGVDAAAVDDEIVESTTYLVKGRLSCDVHSHGIVDFT